MAKLLKDIRKMSQKGDKFVFLLYQEQEYEKEAKDKIVEDWNKELVQKQEWLRNFEEHKQKAVEEVTAQVNDFKDKVIKDISSLKEAIAIFENAEVENEKEGQTPHN